jgi:hypothetical protein
MVVASIWWIRVNLVDSRRFSGFRVVDSVDSGSSIQWIRVDSVDSV